MTNPNHTDTSRSGDLVERLGQAKNNHVLCCQAIARINADARRIEALEAENERLREALSKADEAHWFYYGNDCSSEQCRFGIHECIDEDFEWDNRPVGDHVLQITGARPVPDMWVALHYFTEEEKDARQDDEPYIYTVHATEEEARAALGEKQ